MYFNVKPKFTLDWPHQILVFTETGYTSYTSEQIKDMPSKIL
jgi:hypothetical protein